MENLQKYFIKSSHDIFEYSYENGEGKQVNSYQMEAEILAGSPAEALESYSSEILGYENTGNFYSCFLVDKNCSLACTEDIEKWKKGEILLYSDNINFEIYQLNKIITL